MRNRLLLWYFTVGRITMSSTDLSQIGLQRGEMAPSHSSILNCAAKNTSYTWNLCIIMLDMKLTVKFTKTVYNFLRCPVFWGKSRVSFLITNLYLFKSSFKEEYQLSSSWEKRFTWPYHLSYWFQPSSLSKVLLVRRKTSSELSSLLTQRRMGSLTQPSCSAYHIM